ncbi:DUF5994 family protein [Streptomyces sp. NPDC048636]|uniref:DUF5994 family protein n=1 Tax=Streptomyces sp. NPDC048636 TaxID=3155762 RepID=UPI003441A870
MTVTNDHTTSHERVPSPPTRLSLTPASAVPGLLDGAWWPRSRDLLRELPDLTDALDTRWGRITRVSVNPTHWPVIPRKVPATGHMVHVGWFTEQDPHKLILLSYTAGRWDLLVIPPETSAAAAARLMATAATVGGLLTASGLMASESTAHDAREDVSREEEWETDGGPASVVAGSRPDQTLSATQGR